MGEIGIQLPVNDERSILIRRIVWAYNHRPKKIGTILICSHEDLIYRYQLEFIAARRVREDVAYLANYFPKLDTPL